MSKRFQKGSVRKWNRSWYGRYYDENKKRQQVWLGYVASMSKSEAYTKLAEILERINAIAGRANNVETFGEFVEQIFFPLKRDDWKGSTATTTPDRIRRHLIREIGQRKLRDVTREELRALLRKYAHLSFSTVDHLKWDLVDIFRLAFADAYIRKNPAAPDYLVTPRQCKRSDQRVMNDKEVQQLLGAIESLELREQVVVDLALFAGMRPGEIFGLRRGDVMRNFATISRRIYKKATDVDTPKNGKTRPAAFCKRLVGRLEVWMNTTPQLGPDGWLFPSEKLVTPMSADNVWRRYVRPKLAEKGLGWVNFQILRRTNSSLMWANKVDMKVISDLQGHELDVTANVYTKTPLERLIEGVETLEAALVN